MINPVTTLVIDFVSLPLTAVILILAFVVFILCGACFLVILAFWGIFILPHKLQKEIKKTLTESMGAK